MGEQGAKRHNDGWKGIGVTIVILAIATGIGAMFRYLRFTEANILIVYVLGVMITAVITASRMWSVLSSLCSVLLFNFCIRSRDFHSLHMIPGIRLRS